MVQKGFSRVFFLKKLLSEATKYLFKTFQKRPFEPLSSPQNLFFRVIQLAFTTSKKLFFAIDYDLLQVGFLYINNFIKGGLRTQKDMIECPEKVFIALLKIYFQPF